MQSPKLLAKSPSHSLNAEMLSLKILMLLQFAPPPQLLHPPGLHLPGCSPPLQLPGPGHCRAGYLHPGRKQTCQTIDTPIAQSWSPNRRKIGTKTVAPARELKVSRVTCKFGGGSWRHPAQFPPHLRYCILSTLTPPISVLLFIKTGPLKFWIWILSMICLSRGSLKVPVTLMLYGTPCLLWW